MKLTNPVPFLKEAMTQLFQKPSTEAFPAGDPPKAPEGYRGRLVYHPDLCINCGTCMRVCAPQCMTRTVVPLESGEGDVVTFTFDMTSCTFCRLCADFCSRKAIELTDDYMIVGTKHEDFLVTGTFTKMKPVKKPAAPAAAPAQSAAPAAPAQAAPAAPAAPAAAAQAAPAAPAAPAEAEAPAACEGAAEKEE